MFYTRTNKMKVFDNREGFLGLLRKIKKQLPGKKKQLQENKKQLQEKKEGFNMFNTKQSDYNAGRACMDRMNEVEPRPNGMVSDKPQTTNH